MPGQPPASTDQQKWLDWAAEYIDNSDMHTCFATIADTPMTIEQAIALLEELLPKVFDEIRRAFISNLIAMLIASQLLPGFPRLQ